MLSFLLLGNSSCICLVLLISMLDCPEQTHTSPINIFSKTIVLILPLIVMVKGPPAAGVLIFAFHFPLLNAITESTVVFHEQVIVKRSLGSAHPQRVACEFCCRTILLLMIGGNLIMANNFDVPERSIRKQQSRKNFFMPDCF